MAGLAARFNQDPTAVGAVAVAPPRVVLMLRLAAEAGLRRGEIARIHSTDLAGEQQGPVLLPASPIGRRRAPRLVALLGRPRGWDRSCGW